MVSIGTIWAVAMNAMAVQRPLLIGWGLFEKIWEAEIWEATSCLGTLICLPQRLVAGVFMLELNTLIPMFRKDYGPMTSIQGQNYGVVLPAVALIRKCPPTIEATSFIVKCTTMTPISFAWTHQMASPFGQPQHQGNGSSTFRPYSS